jgi:competence protein ComEA
MHHYFSTPSLHKLFSTRTGGPAKYIFGLLKQMGVPMKSITMKSLITLLAAGLFSAWAWAAQPVNINAASAEELSEALKGIGMSKAEAIIKYRNENGQFKHVDELVNVKGIGIRTVDINREYILLDNSKLANSK